MKKKIDAKQLRVGMFLSELCGSWLKHPFWRSAFVIEKAEDIQTILRSGITNVIIDTTKGLDVEMTSPPPAPPSPKKEPPQKPEASPKCSIEAEWDRARKICDEAKTAVTAMFKEVRMGNTVNVKDVQPIVEDISSSVNRNPHALISMARLKTVDDYTYLHSVAVSAMMAALAKDLQMDDDQVVLAAQGGLLHDLGKAAIPLDVLNKPGKLTDDEFRIVKSHPQEGHAMLAGNAHIQQQVLDVVLHHHEKLDGTGYPDGLADENITLFARMGAVCDVYDAITSDRPYKKGWSPALAIKRMASWQGHFDPKVLQAFIKILGIYPVGSLVKLVSGKLGVVLEQSTQSLLEPKIKVFFSTKSKAPIKIEEIILSSKNCQEKITGIEDPKKWGFKNMNDLWTPSD